MVDSELIDSHSISCAYKTYGAIEYGTQVIKYVKGQRSNL